MKVALHVKHYHSILFSLLCVYGIMVYFTLLTPYSADDLVYGYKMPFSLSGMLQSQFDEYFTWSGRSVVLFTARCLLSAPQIFNILLTPLVFVGLIFFGMLLVWGREWRVMLRGWHIVVTFGCLWFFVPSFGASFLWIMGTPNYLWAVFYVVCFLVPLRFLYDDMAYVPAKWVQILYPLLGIVAGWGHEVISGFAFLAAAGMVLMQIYRKARVPLWLGLGTLCMLAGCILLIAAPGNRVRLQHEAYAAFRAMSWGKRLARFANYYAEVQVLLVPVYALCAWSLWRLRRVTLGVKAWGMAAVLFALSQGMLVVLVFAPDVAPRVLTSTVFFCVLLAVYLLARAVPSTSLKSFSVYTLFIVILSVHIVWQGSIFWNSTEVTAERERLLLSGEQQVALPAYPVANNYFYIDHHVDGLRFDKDFWINVTYQSLYGVQEVVLRAPVCEVGDKGRVITLKNEQFSVRLCENNEISIRGVANSAVAPNDFKVAYLDDEVSMKNALRLLAYTFGTPALPEEIRDPAFLGTRFASRRCKFNGLNKEESEWVCQIPPFASTGAVLVGIENEREHIYKAIPSSEKE